MPDHNAFTLPMGSVRPAEDGKSKEAAQLLDALMSFPPPVRNRHLAELDEVDTAHVFAAAAREMGTPYGVWRDDPVGFIELVLGETLWSTTRQIMSQIPHQKRIAVPSCYGSSKTWSAARAALWMAFTHPPGTVKVVTIAPLWRQVIRLMWPEIRAAHSRAGLEGVVDQAQLKLYDRKGLEHVVGYGIAASPYNEASVQGIHAAGGLLLVVDEAGGLSRTIGQNLAGMLVGSNTHMLAIGNPPADDEGSWFEKLSTDEDSKALVIPISAYSTPNLSGEAAPRCRSCPPEAPVHSLALHLVDQEWVQEAIDDHGEDAPFVQAKVHARFPKGGTNRAIPSSWIEAARDQDEPEGPDYVRLDELGLEGEHDRWKVRRGAWVRLGVDVAADGGDEFVIARIVGDLGTVEHSSSGPANANAVHVAGVVLQHILRAQALAAALGTVVKVRVKIDAIGLGWGVACLLEEWGAEGKHQAEIVAVKVSESTDRKPERDTMIPYSKRDEMWLAGRTVLQPGRDGQPPALRLRVPKRAAAQLSGPMLGTSSTGQSRVESKASMKKRGLPSPDQAEGVLLGVYEPVIGGKKKKARLLV